MQLVASLLLLNGGALAAQIAARAVGVSPSLTTRSTPNMRFSLRQSCDEGQECADGCIPSDAQCCDVIVGIYCEASEGYCTTSNTCCPEGLECTGNDDSSRECTDDETRCGLCTCLLFLSLFSIVCLSGSLTCLFQPASQATPSAAMRIWDRIARTQPHVCPRPLAT